VGLLKLFASLLNLPYFALKISKTQSQEPSKRHSRLKWFSNTLKQWRDPKILNGGKQFIISVLIYRKRAQRNICLLHGKKRTLQTRHPVDRGDMATYFVM